MEFMRKYVVDGDTLIILPNSRKLYTGKAFSLYNDGTTKEEGNYRNGLKDGRWTYYTNVGNGKYEITYKAGTYAVAVFTDNLGTDYTGLPTTGTYEPEQDGIFLFQRQRYRGDEYDFLKYPMDFATIKDGEKDGLWTRWYSNGQKEEEVTYKDGEIDGLETVWYYNGQKKYESTFKDGEWDGLWTKWYENGQKKNEGTYKDDKPDGLHTYWYDNGQKKEEGTHKDGLQDGVWTSWFKYGQKWKEKTYKDGKLDGLFTWWYDNGQKYREYTYKDGELIDIKRY